MIDQVEQPRTVLQQIAYAYEQMVKKAFYRPGAPSDGFGNLTTDEPVNRAEIERYAKRWWDEEDERTYWIGCCEWLNRPATIFAVEAARNLCAGRLGDRVALKLLKLAVKEMEKVVKSDEVEEFERLYFKKQRSAA
jgi:hypothetical protein